MDHRTEILDLRTALDILRQIPVMQTCIGLSKEPVNMAGISTKTIFDCTVPFELKEHFRRAPFIELDPEKWLHG